MTTNNDILAKEFNIAPEILELISEAEKEASARFEKLDATASFNQYKVLRAFQQNRLRDSHFSWNTGYGYDDAGREVTEKIYADIFRAEAAIVRPLIVNGTHALSLTLQLSLIHI